MDMKKQIDRLHMGIRGLFTSAVVKKINDAGATQTVDVQTHHGHTRAKVPVHQQFGLASKAPADGAVTHVLNSDGDPANMVALPPANPNTARVGNLAEGETLLYDAIGQKIYLKEGKIVRVDAKTSMDVRIAGQLVMQVNKEGVSIKGKLQVSGDITSEKDVKAGSISLKNHTHGGVEAGSSSTQRPQ